MASKSREFSSAALLAAAMFLACAAIAAALAAWPGSAGAGARTVIILGRTPQFPPPACPSSPCQAIGSVTGFQIQNGPSKLPFRVPAAGDLVAYTLSLADPSASQRRFFNGFFGTPPEARVAVIRRVPRTTPPKYRLIKQSPLVVLSPYYGQVVRFRLGIPLPVAEGDIVALTVPTWAPILGLRQGNGFKWRASRNSNRCLRDIDIKRGSPHQVPGAAREYGCKYVTARLLYTATIVEDSA
jgi:hypothetical protein